jgi:asparagine synthase (glutamine-hydrolysing)
MCGIVGMLNEDGRPVDPGLLRRMTGTLAHRGPDDEGVFCSGPVGLGHRRLSVIDLEGGHQPMTNEDGTVYLVSNSEIYNHRDLRLELEGRGHRFRSGSDTEVILHLYEERGPACVESLNGMFAFALWDARERRLLLARDRAGKKPLYLARSGPCLLFGSTPDPFFLHPQIDSEIDLAAVDLYLSLLYVPGPGTIYRKVQKLEPGHWLEWAPGRGWKKSCYWRLQYLPKHSLKFADAVEQVGEHLESAVRIRLESDVPLGAFLSGGLDSSLVVALMAASLQRPVKTFSVAGLSPLHDELPHARRMSRVLETVQTVCFFQPEDLFSLERALVHCPEPLADPSLVPLFLLAGQARREVTVVLGGDAGDEDFAGYDRYVNARLARLPLGIQPALSRLLGRGCEKATRRRITGTPALNRLQKFLHLLTLPLPEGHLSQFDQLGFVNRQALYREEIFRSLPATKPAAACFAALFSAMPKGMEWLDRLLAADVGSYLAWDILPKVDTATMAHALECRSPFLDYRLMEFVARLPSEFKLRGLTRKYILKRYGERWLPPAIVRRRKKGFGVPLAEWLRGKTGADIERLTGGKDARCYGLLRPGAVGALLEEHRSGRADRAYLLYALAVLEQWLRLHPARIPCP